ncbi:IDEAL domain-containing protein [Cytobacillus horneckiae]|uniref:IDEAL domain-containing protein n=1 Tax=Cytobacillus horneckiae TaxID=549687 RepID=UPI003D9A4F5D
MKEKSYAELMKASAMKRKREKEAFVLDLYIDMVLSEAILKRKKETIQVKLDEALDQQNEADFIYLSNEYNELHKQFGT